MSPGSAQISAPPSKLSPHLHHGAPNPEESEYFYEEFVEYPQGAEIIANHSITTQAPPIVHLSPTPTPVSSHYIPGDTPTLYAGTITKVKQPNATGVDGNTAPNNDSPFTLFGYPLPSITTLWNNPVIVGRSTGKRVDANDLPVSVTPYEKGFIPSLGPPRTRPNWVLGPNGNSSNNFSTQVRYESLADNKKQSFTSTRQQHSSVLEPAKNPMKFLYPASGNSPGIRNGNNIPIDHRGSLPIRDDSVWRNNRKPTSENKMDELLTTPQPEVYLLPSTTHSPPPPPPKQRFQMEPSLPSDIFNETELSDKSIVMKKGVLPIVFSEDLNDTSTESFIGRQHFYEPPTEQPMTMTHYFETSTQATTQINYHHFESTTVQIETTTTKPPPQTNLQLLVPGGYQPPSGTNKAVITKVENVIPGRAPSTSRYYNTPPSTLSPAYVPTTPVSSASTESPQVPNDQQSEGTWWYYRDYNRTNTEPFRGEYLLEDNPAAAASVAPKLSIIKIFYLVPLLYFLFI